MRIALAARISPIKQGFSAHGVGLDLAGHGPTEEAAMTSLREAAEAWCRGLLAGERLVQALESRGLTWTEDGELVTVDVNRN